MPDDRRDQNDGGRDAVRKRIAGGRREGGGLDPLSDPAVIEEHIELHRDGYAEDHDDEYGKFRRFRVDDLLYGGFEEE